MAGMKRFVTYIYSYENREKGSNSGFAKIEIRGEECRIELHLRGVSGNTNAKVALFRVADRRMQGFSLGELIVAGGTADFRTMFRAGKLSGSSYSIYDMEGIILFCEDERIFMSRWSEGEPVTVDKEHYKMWEKPAEVGQEAEDGTIEAAGQPMAKEQYASVNQAGAGNQSQAVQPVPREHYAVVNQAGAGNQSQAVQPGSREQYAVVNQTGAGNQSQAVQPGSREHYAVVNQAGAGNQSQMVQPVPREHYAVVNQAGAGNQSQAVQPGLREQYASGNQTGARNQDATGQPEAGEPYTAVNQPRAESITDDAALSQEDVAATEIPMRNIFPQYTWEEIWESLKTNHAMYTPFEDEEIVCLRIELKDIRNLPKRYWYLGNNSFLLHGFFNYHYLVLGRKGEHYFLGVPGIFQHQERVMATIFGFPEFLPTAFTAGTGEHREEEQQNTEPINRFGFWFRYIEE